MVPHFHGLLGSVDHGPVEIFLLEACYTPAPEVFFMSKPKYVRLSQPMVRDARGGKLRPATWDEALDRTARGLKSAVEKHGGQSFGVFSCSKATNEMNFIAQKFTRVVMGSNNIDSCNRT